MCVDVVQHTPSQTCWGLRVMLQDANNASVRELGNIKIYQQF